MIPGCESRRGTIDDFAENVSAEENVAVFNAPAIFLSPEPLRSVSVSSIPERKDFMVRAYLAVVSLMILLTTAFPACGEEAKVDIGKFVQELQRMDASGGKIELVWWIPTEYWEESFRHSPMTEEQKKSFISGVDDYVIVAIVDGELNAFGPSKWRGVEEIRKDLSIRLASGETLTPLADEEISHGTRALLLVMKPMFAKMLGDFGTGLELVCIRGKDDQGNRILDPRSEDRFAVKYREKSYDWRLPLGCLLPPRFDATTHEQFPGNFRFNPFTGAELTDVVPSP